MKTLELKQMENVQGGNVWGLIGCIALGAATNFLVGFACAALLNPTPAY